MVITFNHEINNPLASAHLSLDLLSAEPNNTHRENLKKAPERISAVVKKIEKISKDSGVSFTSYLGATKMVKID